MLYVDLCYISITFIKLLDLNVSIEDLNINLLRSKDYLLLYSNYILV